MTDGQKRRHKRYELRKRLREQGVSEEEIQRQNAELKAQQEAEAEQGRYVGWIERRLDEKLSLEHLSDDNFSGDW